MTTMRDGVSNRPKSKLKKSLSKMFNLVNYKRPGK